MNHDPNAIMNGMAEKNRLLSAKNDEYTTLSEKFAAAKRDYHIAAADKVIELKKESHPVTIINDLVKGDKQVAELRYKKDVAEGVMKACKESMADIRAALDSYRSILTWLRSEKENG